ncbi:MAG TPA: class I SAM-dependent methyltransferase [Dehalococcoidia bacterium]|nr:class I SAM-dependent methyltransferase [Dehalococcoidia bacterium]
MPEEVYASDELAELYDFAWGGGTDDLPMYEQFARRGELPSLELGVGTGRVALHLARQGLDVVGIDDALPMLARAEAALDPETARHARFVEADMRAFDLGGEKFDLVYCAGNTFQHLLDAEAQLGCLRSVARHLARGGLYVMQLRTPRAIDWGAERTPLYLRWVRDIPGSGDRLMRFDSTTAAAAAQTATTVHCFDRVSPDGSVRRRVVQYTLRYTALSELKLLARAAGLAVTAVYGDADLSPYSDDSDTMVVVAQLEDS